jgi:hypothetical protein
MVYDKRHRRGMFDADDMLIAPDSLPALPWQCPGEGFLGPIAGWRDDWMNARRQGGPAEGALFRNFTFKRGDGDQRFLSSKLAFAEGSPTIDLVRTIATQLLRLAPLSLSQDEINALGLRWHGPRHVLIEAAELVGVAKGRHDLLGRWDHSASAKRHAGESWRTSEARAQVQRTPAQASAMAALYVARASSPVEQELRLALIRVVQAAPAGSDWTTFWPRGLNSSKEKALLSAPHLAALAAAARAV